MLRIKKSLLTMFSHQLQGLVAPGIKTAIAADSSPVPTAHSTVTSRTRVPGPTFCCLGGGPVSSAALMASRFRVSSTACGFGAYSRSVDPNLPPLGGSQFDTLSAGLRSNLSVLEGPESARRRRQHKAGDRRLSIKIFKIIAAFDYTGVRDDRRTPAASKTDCTNSVLALL